MFETYNLRKCYFLFTGKGQYDRMANRAKGPAAHFARSEKARSFRGQDTRQAQAYSPPRRFFQFFHEFNKHVFAGATFVVAVGLRRLLRPTV